MNIGELIKKITSFFRSLKDGFISLVITPMYSNIQKVNNTFKEKIPDSKKRLLIFSSTVVFLLMLIILLTVLIRSCSSTTEIADSKNKNTQVQSTDEYSGITLSQEIIKPDEPSLPDDYYLFRQRNEQMSQEDIDKWFTKPDETMINQLHQENELIIQDLLENTP